jgi:putative peptidoglycan lipid II flippase
LFRYDLTLLTEGLSLDNRPQPSHKYAFLVAAGIFLSRFAGLIREHIFARYFGGTSIAAGIFRAGLRIPNFLQNLLGEGVLSAAFIPVYSRLLAKEEKETAGKVAGAIFSLLALIVSIIVVLGMTFTPLIVNLIVPGFKDEARDLTIKVVRILFPGVGILVLSAWCLGVLNSHRKFFLSYVAPVLWNAAMIATMVGLGGRLGQTSLCLALAWGTVAGSVLQFAIQAPFVLRYAKTIRFGIATSLPQVRTVIRNTGPAILSRGVVQISAYIDQMIASFLQNGAGAVSILGYAQTIYLLPVSLFGMSVAAAELPQMSSAVGSQDELNAHLRRRVESGIRQVTFFIIPTVVAFLLIGKYLVAALYQAGRFGKADTDYVWYVLCGSVIGLLAATRGRIYNSAFYALQDTVTPLRFAIVRISLTALLGYLFAFPLRPFIEWIVTSLLGLPAPRVEDAALVFGAVGLTSSAGLAGWVEYLLLHKAIAKRIGAFRITGAYSIKLWGCAIAAGLAALVLANFGLPGIREFVRIGNAFAPAFNGLMIAAVFGLTYLCTTWIFGIDEVKRLLRR